MKKRIRTIAIVLLTGAIAPMAAQATTKTANIQTSEIENKMADNVHSSDDRSNLAGTSWRLFKYHAGGGKASIPDDKAKYTIAFNDDGSLNVRIDCNRGRGTWKSPAPNRLEFGPLALTRAMCPPGSLHDIIAKNWELVRFYTIKDGYLFISLSANGGVYEFEPIRAAN